MIDKCFESSQSTTKLTTFGIVKNDYDIIAIDDTAEIDQIGAIDEGNDMHQQSC